MGTEDSEIPEEMGAFFDLRAAGYDDHMRDNIFETDTKFRGFYESVSAPIEVTEEPLHILDLECGTGLELEALLQKVPNARIMGVDLSENMLELLRASYAAHMSQITLVADSFLTMPLGVRAYDYILSAMSMHHVLRDVKLELYQRLHAALKPGGKYIEGDSVTSAEMEDQFITEYHEQAAAVPPAPEGHYHIDVPFSIETQRSLLLEAGFRDFELLWRIEFHPVWHAAVYVATA